MEFLYGKYLGINISLEIEKWILFVKHSNSVTALIALKIYDYSQLVAIFKRTLLHDGGNKVVFKKKGSSVGSANLW